MRRTVHVRLEPQELKVTYASGFLRRDRSHNIAWCAAAMCLPANMCVLHLVASAWCRG